jgi:hypothetical protein
LHIEKKLASNSRLSNRLLLPLCWTFQFTPTIPQLAKRTSVTSSRNFLWAIPGLYSQGENLGMVSYVIVILASVAGIAGTLTWWELADQTH